MSMNLGKLNNGLTRIVSIANYPKPKKQYIERQTKGRVFRIGVLHKKELSDAALQRNRRGFINAQLNTVAHAPSMYHWLFHRCGIPFAETQEMVRSGGLKVDGVIVSNVDDLESQLRWETFQQLDIQVRSSSLYAQQMKDPSVMNRTSAKTEKERENVLAGGQWVPALKRALHRTYILLYIHPGVSISSEESDPRSFVHRMAPLMGSDPSALLGLNILRPIGFMNGMKGIGIATNDVAMVRYWNNESLGNFGCYDVRFARGTPPEVIRRATEDISSVVETDMKPRIPADIRVPCSCVRSLPPPLAQDIVASQLFPNIALHAEDRLLVSTPLMPYRLVRRIRKNGGFVSLIRSGPFALHASLVQQKMRLLSPTELALLFTFERRLKTNRMVMSLREFSADADISGD